MIASPQPGQRTIVPIAVAYTIAAPIGPTASQLAQITSALVISKAKICPSTPPAEGPLACVCGPTALVESVASALVDLGHEPQRVKTERFGPSGG